MRANRNRPPDSNDPPVSTSGTTTGAATTENVRGIASLKYPEFRLLLISSPFGGIGNAMKQLVTAWQVYELTNSPALLGLTFLFQGIPGMAFSVFGGTLADMFDRRKLINISQGYTILSAILFGVLTITGAIAVWHIYILTFMASAVGSIANPSRRALISSLVPRSHVLNAITLQTSLQQGVQIIGPTVAGFALYQFGAGPAYFTAAFLTLPGYYAISKMKKIEEERKKAPARFNVQSIFGGLIFAWQTQVILWILLMDTVTNVLGYWHHMMPVIAKDILDVGPRGLGILLSAPALGAFLGFGIILTMGNFKRKGLWMIGTVIIYNVMAFVFAYSTIFILSLALLAVMGAVDAFSRSIRNTALQLLPPEDKRGRVVALSQIFTTGGNSMGGAYLGLMAQLIGLQLALAIGAVVSGVFAVGVGVFSKKVRNFNV